MTKPSKPYLLDVSVLLALLDEHHEMHQTVFDWFVADAAVAWATCPLVENGFVRIISQAAYPNINFSVSMAIDRLASLITNAKGHEHWSDDVHLTDQASFQIQGAMSPRRVTDVYLLALAVKHVGVFATLDTRLSLDGIVGATPAHLQIIWE